MSGVALRLADSSCVAGGCAWMGEYCPFSTVYWKVGVHQDNLGTPNVRPMVCFVPRVAPFGFSREFVQLAVFDLLLFLPCLPFNRPRSCVMCRCYFAYHIIVWGVT